VGEIEVRYAPGRENWAPEVSLAMPCYNEEACLGETAPALIDAFEEAAVDFELVLVDNGSSDRTGAIIDAMIAAGRPITKVRLAVNRGYGHGIQRGLEACRAPLIGYLCADGQVAARDVVHTYYLMAHRREEVLAKVRRRLRKDSWKRKLVSVCYNGLMYTCFGWLGSIDLNASPKLFSRENWKRMQLRSTDWFLDPEILLKARGLGLQVIELNVEGHPRAGGLSHVRRETMLEFLRNIWRYWRGQEFRAWQGGLGVGPNRGSAANRHAASPEIGGSGLGLEGIRILSQNRPEDSRGFLQKILTASQIGGRLPQGELYVTAARPGEVKGNHFHRRMGEWFAVVQGEALLHVVDPVTGERRTLGLSAVEPSTVFVPAGIAHAISNPGSEMMICVAAAEREHDATDVYPYEVSTPGAVRREISG
jgi:dTDP-4-dehydrorhamnose 3,5-epimerase-like enzyme